MKSTHWWILGVLAAAAAAWYFFWYSPATVDQGTADDGRQDPELMSVAASASSINAGVIAGFGGLDMSAYNGVDSNGIATSLGQ
jgi:hypothetical protein